MFEPRKPHFWRIFTTETNEDRGGFITRVFIQFGIFIIVALIQWVLVLASFRSEMLVLYLNHESTVLVTFFFSMLLFALFAISSQLRHIACLNWLLVVLIVEGMICSLGFLVLHTNLLYFFLSLLMVTILLVLVMVTAVFTPFDFTSRIYVGYLLGTFLFSLSIYAIMFFILYKYIAAGYAFVVLLAIVIMSFFLYHVQCIVGGNTMQTNIRDALLASVVLFYDFLALFMLTFFVRPELKAKK